MFNVKIKISNDNLISFNNLIQKFINEYSLFVTDKKDGLILRSNLKHFSIKIAKVLISHEHWPSNKEYSFSVNVNSWIAFRDFYEWLSITYNIDRNPYYSTFYRQIKESIERQINIQKNSNLNYLKN